MKFISILGWLALAAGLPQFGCGGKQPQKNSAQEQTRDLVADAPAVAKGHADAQADNRPVIVAFGDSLTAGFGAEPGNSYPDFLQKDLDRQKYHWRVINAGVSGDTTTDGLNRLSEVLAAKPRIVILEFGGNDGLRGLPLTATRSNLEQMIEGLQSAGARIVLAGMTLPPNYGPDYIQGFQKIYKELAPEHKLTLIPFLLEKVALHRDLMQRDGIHPTGPGNALVAETVLEYLRPLLGRPSGASGAEPSRRGDISGKASGY